MPIIKRIIDKRTKEKFLIDDAYLNGQAKLCGWQATLVYNSLCRHANINQESFPSIKLIGEELAISKNTILKGIKNLEEYNIIQIKKNRSKSGRWLNNAYILTDKSNWRTHQVPVEDTDQVPVGDAPSPCRGLTQVPVRDTKETHSEGNTYKEILPLKEKKDNTPKISKQLVDKFLSFTGMIRPDGDYELNNLFPAKIIDKFIREKLKLWGDENPTDEKVLWAFDILLKAMDEFHKKNATNLSYIKNNFNKLYNLIK